MHVEVHIPLSVEAIMLKRFTFEMPEDWYSALEQEREKSGENMSQLLRRIIRRSLASRGHLLTDLTIVPGKYDRDEKCLLGLESELQHEERLRNRQRVRQQLEKKRVEKQRAEFVARLKFDPTGGVWTANESEEVGWIDQYGELEVTDRQFTADEVRAELRSVTLIPGDNTRYGSFAS
jgi:hypothetical protein